MPQFTFRPAAIGDLETVHQIISRQNTVDYGEPLRSLDDLRELWNSTGFSLETDSLIAFAPNGEAAGFAELLDKDDQYIYLTETHQSPEFAAQLLAGTEELAKTQRRSSTEPFVLYGRAVEGNRVVRQAFERNGYSSTLSFLIMQTMLTEEPPTPQWADGINVRALVPGQDEQAVYRADEEASEDKGYHVPLSFDDWAKRMSLNSELFDPGLWFLAYDGNELAGVCLNFIVRDSNTGWVDHLGVRRTWRKRGIGKALLLHTFREMYRRGVTNVKLSVDSMSLTNAPRLYESVGMKTVQHYHIYKKQFS